VYDIDKSQTAGQPITTIFSDNIFRCQNNCYIFDSFVKSSADTNARAGTAVPYNENTSEPRSCSH